MADSLQGQFLVAANHLRDPNFYRSVVLMLEDNDEGSMGLVINHPSSISVHSAFAKTEQLVPCTDPIYSGGPVDTTSLFILHNCPELGGDSERVADGIYLTGSNESFESLLSDKMSCEQKCGFRICCGYAGWGVRQLAQEIDRGDWRMIPADSELVFANDPYEVWETCNQQVCELNRILPHDVKDPEWN